MARWQSDQHLQDHFEAHGRKMGVPSIEDYGASAQATLDTGIYFTYFDRGADLERVGCFDRVSGLLVVLNEDDEIVSHFPATERYIRRLPYNNYDG